MSDNQNSLPDYEPITAKELNARIRVLADEQTRVERCQHEFAGWREFADGNGGEQVCKKCGVGAMKASLRDGL